MAIYKIADNPGLVLAGKFVCSSSTSHHLPPARVNAVEGEVLSFSPLLGGDFDTALGCRTVLPAVSVVVGRRRRHWTDLACDTAEEAIAVWRQVTANRRAADDLERTLRDSLVHAAVAGTLGSLSFAAGPSAASHA